MSLLDITIITVIVFAFLAFTVVLAWVDYRTTNAVVSGPKGELSSANARATALKPHGAEKAGSGSGTSKVSA